MSERKLEASVEVATTEPSALVERSALVSVVMARLVVVALVATSEDENIFVEVALVVVALVNVALVLEAVVRTTVPKVAVPLAVSEAS